MSPVETHPSLPIELLRSETNELVHLSLKAPLEFLSAYKFPGQYVKLSTGEHKPVPFAIANAPGQPGVELLMKRGSPLADAVSLRIPGDALRVSLPMGLGYPIAAAEGKSVVIIGVGSGMAPLRALMQSMLLKRQRYGQIRFIYGARTPASFPYPSELSLWQEQGVEITRVCSQPKHDLWAGPVGRVQQTLLASSSRLADGSVAYVCGMKSMVEDVKAALATLGLPAERVYQNF